MFAAFTKTLGQLSDPRIRSILWKTLLLSLGLFILLFLGVGVMLAEIQFFTIGWIEYTAEWMGSIATLVLALDKTVHRPGNWLQWARAGHPIRLQ